MGKVAEVPEPLVCAKAGGVKKTTETAIREEADMHVIPLLVAFMAAEERAVDQSAATEQAQAHGQSEMVGNADHGKSFWFENAAHIAQGGQGIEQVLEDVLADHNVEGSVDKRKLRIQVEVAVHGSYAVALGDFQAAVRVVEADNLVIGGQVPDVVAGTAPQAEDPLADKPAAVRDLTVGNAAGLIGPLVGGFVLSPLVRLSRSCHSDIGATVGTG